MKKLNYFFTLILCMTLIFGAGEFHHLKIQAINFRELASSENRAMFIDGYRDAMAIRYDHFRTEKEEINAMHFIVREDTVGLAYLAELRDAALRGVKVKVIFDHFGSTGSSSSRKLTPAMVKVLMDAGVDIKFFNVYPKNTLDRLEKPKVWLKRMHEKVVIFRGHNAFLMGDRDLSGRYFGLAQQGERFLSRDLYVVGDETAEVENYFDKTFSNNRFTKYYPFEERDEVPTPEEVEAARKKLDAFSNKSENHLSKKLTDGAHDVKKWKEKTKKVKHLKFIGDSDNEFDHRAYEVLLDMISMARESVTIQTPYLILNDKNHAAIKSARKNGAKVEHITNNADLTDEVWVPPAADEDLMRLAKEGDDVYENAETRIFHSKGYVVDKRYFLYGSDNLDNRSMVWDRESAVYVDDEELAKDLLKLINRDKGLSKKIDPKRPSYRSQSCKKLFLWFLSSKLARPIL